MSPASNLWSAKRNTSYLPTSRYPGSDRFEKPDRYSPRNSTANMKNLIQNAASSRPIRLATLGIIVIFILLFSFGSPVSSFHDNNSQSGSIVDGSSQSKDTNGELKDLNDPFSCKKSYDGKRPITQYAIMIDAGSTGSRVHVYTFNNCEATPQLVKEDFKMIKPGLSSFDEDAEGAAASLDELLDVALQNVPKDSQGCTPVAVKATAGLRLLGEDKSNKILEAVRNRLETKYPFAVVPGDGISIMEGKDEGVYAWITANYLLGNIGSSDKTPTAAVFDLGGGSTQIVFEPSFKIPTQKMSPGDHKYDLEFGNRQFSLYQHSHLGYGLMEARKKIHSLVVSNYLKQGIDPTSRTLVNPCIPPGVKLSAIDVKIEDESAESSATSKEYTVNMTGPKDASPLQCRKLAESILNKDKECTVAPCSFNGIHQPSLVESFMRESDIYIFSYFYDRTFPIGMPSSFSIDELSDLAKKVCMGSSAYDSFQAIDGAVKELESEPEWCLDLSFMSAILRTGYDIPVHREVKIAKKIKNNELGWCLGASLPLLDQGSAGWHCRLHQE